MKRFTLALLILTIHNAAAAVEVLDFHQAIERALQKSPEFNTLTLKAQNAKMASKNSWAALFPTIDLQASYAYNQYNTSTYVSQLNPHIPWSNQAGVSISENLYDNGVSWRQARIAEFNEKIQNLNLESGRGRLVVETAKAYYDYSLAVAVADLQRQQIETLKTQFRTIEGRYRQGMSSNRDYLRIKAQVQSAEIGLLSQEIQVNQSKQALRQVIGDAEAAEFKAFIPGKNNLKESLDPVKAEDTYEFKVAEYQNRIAEISYESSRRTAWPRLSLKGSYNYTVPQYFGEKIAGVDQPYWNLQFMILLDYRLWDWGSSYRNVAIAENQKRIDDNSQTSNRLKLRQDLVQLESQLRLLQQSYQVSQQILMANQDAYDSLNRGYRDGKISYLDLITALNTLYSSRTQDLTLRFNFLKTRLDWAYYEGKVDEVLKKQ